MLKILYLFPRRFFERKMSVGRAMYGEAVSQQEGVSLQVWGHGWDGYDVDKSLADNIAARGQHYDIAWIYKPDMLMNVAGCKIPKVCCYNEAWPDTPERAIGEVRENGIDLVVYHHQNDGHLFDGVRAVHIPHSAPGILHCPTPISQRPIDCVLTGVQHPYIYPTRALFRGLLETGDLYGVIREHPGYRLPSRNRVLSQYRDYCDSLQQAKISLCCTSRYKYLLAKIVESMMAGCVVVTDAADDDIYRQHVRPYVLEVDRSWNSEQIGAEVKRLLADQDRMQWMATMGRASAISNFSMENYASRFVYECKSLLGV